MEDKRNKLKCDEDVYAYISGFFDAEGYIGTSLDKRHKLPAILLRISIANTNYEILVKIKKVFSGSISEDVTHNSKRMTLHPNWKKSWQWRISDRSDVRFFLEKILPYSIVKRQQIKLGLDFLELVKDSKMGKDISLEEQNMRQLISDRLKYIKDVKYSEEDLRLFDNKIHEKIINTLKVQNIVHSYVAGFFDGERCIGTIDHSRNPPTTSLVSSITNTNIEILLKIRSVYGGNMKSIKMSKTHLNYKKEWGWIMSERSVHKLFLEKIYPYTTVKRQQIEYGLKFLEMTSNSSGKRISQEEQKIREFLSDKLKELKSSEYTDEEIRIINNNVNNILRCKDRLNI